MTVRYTNPYNRNKNLSILWQKDGINKSGEGNM